MAGTTRAKTAASKQAKPVEETHKDSKTSRQRHNSQRRALYKKAKRARQIQELNVAIQGAKDATTKKELSKLRGQIFNPRKRDSEKLLQLEKLVQQQREEILQLKEALQGGHVPNLEPPMSPTVAEIGEEPDSSPIKIRQQLMMEVMRSPSGVGAEPEHMEGVDSTITTSIENDVDYPTLPSVEGDDAAEETKESVEQASTPTTPKINTEQQTEPTKQAGEEPIPVAGGAAIRLSGTPLKASQELRDSSADSNAGTPRNVRRSPRKKAKRRSFAGHPYA